MNESIDVTEITCFDRVPKSLKIWFQIHFGLDILVAIPLFLIPTLFLEWLGWQNVDPMMSRIVAAALFAIGGVSYLSRTEQVDTYKVLISMKLIWSISAEIGILFSFLLDPQLYPPTIWIFFGIYVGFSFLWGYWWNVLRNYE